MGILHKLILRYVKRDNGDTLDTQRDRKINEKTDCLKYHRLNLYEGHGEERNSQIFSSSAEILNKTFIARILPKVNSRTEKF